MMQLANSTFYMSGAEARLSTSSSASSNVGGAQAGTDGGGGILVGPSTAAVYRLRKSDNPRRTGSRAVTLPVKLTTAMEEVISPNDMQASSSAPISPTLSPSSRLMLKRKQLNASLALRTNPFSTSSSACSTSSSAASSLVSFGSSSKSSSLKRSSPEEGNLASRLRNLQISELIDAILLVEGKLKKEQKMIARELRSRDLQISQQLKEIEKYRQERKQNLCGFCQKKMDNVSPAKAQTSESKGNVEEQQVKNRRSIEVQTEEVTGFKGVMRLNGGKGDSARRAAEDQEQVTPDDDWYANGNSDNENEKGQSPVSMYERGVNPVLERVNQILLQQSMDGSINTDHAEEVAARVMGTSAPTSTVPADTVRAAAPLPHSVMVAAQQYRTELQQQHSKLLQVKVAERMQTTRIPEIRKATTVTTSTPIGKCAPIPVKRPPPLLQKTGSMHPPILMRAHSSPVSTASAGKENEYEVIGSEQDSSNYYMEMQSPIDVKASSAFLMAVNAASQGKATNSGDEVEYNNVLTRKEGLELLKLIAPHPGMPPALPPKPANLMKFKKVVVSTPPTAKIVAMPNHVTQIAKSQLVKSAPEPDYCSISECGANSNNSNRNSIRSNKTPSVVGGGGQHREDEDIEETTSSKASEDTLENIIKLPNVAAIIVPKNQNHSMLKGGSPNKSINNNNNNSVINKDNYITKSVMGGNKQQSPTKSIPAGLISPKAKESSSSVLKDLPPLSGDTKQRFQMATPLRNSGNSAASLVERRHNLMHRLSVQQQHTHHGQMMKRYSMDALSPHIQPEEVKGSSSGGTGGGASSGLFEERIPIQAEFDWYNLDAEFGKFNAQDVIKEAKSSGSESGSVSGGDDERQMPSAKLALDRGLGELMDIERKMTTIERKGAVGGKEGPNKEMVHFC